MAAETEARQHAHELLDRLGPGQLEPVTKLLEVMIHPEKDEDELTDEDRQAVAASREYFRNNRGGAAFRSRTSLPNAASPWTRFATTRANSSPVKHIRFEPYVPAEVRSIERQTAMRTLQALHRYAETCEGDAMMISPPRSTATSPSRNQT